MNQENFIEKVKQEFQNEVDSIEINQELLRTIKEENPKKKVVLPFWFYHSFWKYSFGIAALLFAFLYFTKPTPTKELIVYREVPSEISVDTVFVKDTVFIERETIKTDLLVSYTNKPRTKQNKTRNEENDRIQSTFVFEEQYFNTKQLENQQKSIGTSSNESGELAQFLGVNI